MDFVYLVHNYQEMRILNVRITEKDYRKFGITSTKISLDTFIEKIKNVIVKDALEKCHSIAEKSGLSKMTLKEINSEIEAERNAKSNP